MLTSMFVLLLVASSTDDSSAIIVWNFRLVSEMTCYVSTGTINSTRKLTPVFFIVRAKRYSMQMAFRDAIAGYFIYACKCHPVHSTLFNYTRASSTYGADIERTL